MNILLITHLYPSYIGQPRSEISYALHNFTAGWVKNNNIIVVHTLYPSYKNFLKEGALYQKLDSSFELDSVKIYNKKLFRFPKIYRYFGADSIKKLLIKINFTPDYIISHMYNSYSIGRKLSVFFKCNFIIGVHNTDLMYIHKKRFYKCLRQCSKIVCRSYSINEKLKEIHPVYESKMLIANSGICEDDIETHEYFLEKAKSWKNKGKIIFITVAAFHKLKNIDITLDALSKIHNKTWEYIIIGDGKEKENLMEITKAKNLTDRVFFLGEKKREEVLSFLKLSDIFILVSAPETFGLVYLEAMSKGNIVVGCKGWGIDGIVKDKINGFLCEARNTDQLVCILNELCTMPAEEKSKIINETEKTILNNTNEIAANKYLEMISKENKIA